MYIEEDNHFLEHDNTNQLETEWRYAQQFSVCWTTYPECDQNRGEGHGTQKCRTGGRIAHMYMRLSTPNTVYCEFHDIHITWGLLWIGYFFFLYHFSPACFSWMLPLNWVFLRETHLFSFILVAGYQNTFFYVSRPHVFIFIIGPVRSVHQCIVNLKYQIFVR